jgi:hypothetical protein
MSTFAVFGMTETCAKKLAERQILKIPIKQKDYDKKISEFVEAIMESKRIAQLSDAYDAPQFAREFLDLLKSSGIRCRGLKVRARIKAKTLDKSASEKKLIWVDKW